MAKEITALTVTSAAVIGDMFGIVDHGFQTVRDMVGVNPFGTHDVTTQGYWNYPPTQPSDYAGPIHQQVANSTPEQLGAGAIETVGILATLGLLLYVGAKGIAARNRNESHTPPKNPANVTALRHRSQSSSSQKIA